MYLIMYSFIIFLFASFSTTSYSMSKICCCCGAHIRSTTQLPNERTPLLQECTRTNPSLPIDIQTKQPLVTATTDILSRFEDVWKMGFEIETSCFKVNAKGEERIGFTIQRVNTNASSSSREGDESTAFAWQLENDTQDKSESGQETDPQTAYKDNLELHTVKGLNKEQVLISANDATKVINHLLSCKESFEINEGFLKPHLTGGNITISKKRVKQSPFLVKKKLKRQQSGHLSCELKPQITYQLPLSNILFTFKRLKEKDIDHHAAKDFLLSLEHPDQIERPAEEPKSSSKRENPMMKALKEHNAADRARKARLYQFTSKLTHAFNDNIKGKGREDLEGFCYLFLFYSRQLFDGSKLSDFLLPPEPGLKQYLPIMSRVPLSQLYDNLSQADQALFQEHIGRLVMSEEGKSFHLMEYTKNYVPWENEEMKHAETHEIQKHTLEISRESPLSLKRWYQSIVIPQARRTKMINDGRETAKVDLLSPPPGLETGATLHEISDSMGALDSPGRGVMIIEIRGYGSRIEKTTTENFETFIKQEADWFFNLCPCQPI